MVLYATGGDTRPLVQEEVQGVALHGALEKDWVGALEAAWWLHTDEPRVSTMTHGVQAEGENVS